MSITPASAAAVLLLRNLADRLESGELSVSALVNTIVLDDLKSSDPYYISPVRTRLEVVTYKPVPIK